MESMRDVLRRSLGRSLEAMPPLDRLQAAWPVACGTAMASRSELLSFTDGVLHILVPDPLWFSEMLSQRQTIERDLARIAGVRLAGIRLTPSRDTLQK